MYQALYRKYRPDTFSDVVGQEHITETLKNELRAGKISHAYLFTGTRGTGKTSCAKILARAVNCENPKSGDPCGQCASCRAIAAGEVMDIVELDAASNNGVDDVRELRDQVAFAPANARYRVYIIDEVHMLSKAAFNALLKTLEEPPAHVIFILATTEVNELPATILSRCQRFDFKRIEQSYICDRLKLVAEREDLTLSDDAALLIASIADGGMRDALSLLDLCASANRNITEEVVSEVCGMAGHDYLFSLCDMLREKDTEKALLLIDKLYSSSVDMTRLCNELISHYRNLMIMKTVSLEEKPIVCSAAERETLKRQALLYDLKDIIFTLDLLQQTLPRMKNASRRCEMELCVIKLCTPALSSSLAALEARVDALEKGGITVTQTVSPTEKAPVNVVVEDEEIPLPDEEMAPPPETEDAVPETQSASTSNEEGERPIKEWNDILSVLFRINPLMGSALKGSCAYIRNDYLLIDSDNPQFREIMNASPHNKETLKRAIADVMGKSYKIGPYHRESKAENKTDPLLGLARKLDLLNK